jgi:hypothetical protein
MALQLFDLFPDEQYVFNIPQPASSLRLQILHLWAQMHAVALREIRILASKFLLKSRDFHNEVFSDSAADQSISGNQNLDHYSSSTGGITISIISPVHGSVAQGHSVHLSVETKSSAAFDTSSLSLNVYLNGHIAASNLNQLTFSTTIEGAKPFFCIYIFSSNFNWLFAGLSHGQHMIEVMVVSGSAEMNLFCVLYCIARALRLSVICVLKYLSSINVLHRWRDHRAFCIIVFSVTHRRHPCKLQPVRV